jgi:small subunit ribosomal protein S4
MALSDPSASSLVAKARICSSRAASSRLKASASSRCPRAASRASVKTRLSDYGTAAAREAEAAPHVRRARASVQQLLHRGCAPPGATGENLLKLLECRLDNVVYRMGFASHALRGAPAGEPQGHPGQRRRGHDRLLPGEGRRRGAGAREVASKQLRITDALQIAAQVGLPEWVEVNEKEMRGVFKAGAGRDDVLPDINENLVVELYSK